jgi:hypothetical protein
MAKVNGNGWAARALVGLLILAGAALTATAVSNRVACAQNSTRIAGVEDDIRQMRDDIRWIRGHLEE